VLRYRAGIAGVSAFKDAVWHDELSVALCPVCVLSVKPLASETGASPSLLIHTRNHAASRFQNRSFLQEAEVIAAFRAAYDSARESHAPRISLSTSACRELPSRERCRRSVRLASILWLEVADERVSGNRSGSDSRKADTVQQKAVSALLGHDIGVLGGAAGVGKTASAISCGGARLQHIDFLVHRRPGFSTVVAQLSLFLGIGPEQSGRSERVRDRNGRLDVAMIRACRKEGFRNVVANYGHVIVDESTICRPLRRERFWPR